MSTPQSEIHICSGVRLNSKYEHSIYFQTRDAQEDYFAGKTVKVLPAYSYLRKSWSLKVQATMEEARTWNYLYFWNSPNGKIYYYFINTVEYVNDNTVELGLELDVIQTYWLDFELLPCFVERHIPFTDGIGEHTVDEGLDLGEFIDNKKDEMDPGELAIMVMCTINPNAQTAAQAVKALPYRYNNVFSGVKIWAVDGSRWVEWGAQIETLHNIGQSEAIMAMWMYPKRLIVLGGEAEWTGGDLALPVERAIDHADGIDWKIDPENLKTLNGYTPRNRKLLTYPYRFMYVTNNQGESGVFHYERFTGDTKGFALSGALSPDGGVRITPVGYNGVEYNYKEGLTITGYPSCAWDSDVYKLWLAQNQNSHNLTMTTGALKVAGGMAGAIATAFTGVGAVAGFGTAISGASQIANHLAQKADRAIEPPQAKGNFSTSVNITNGMQSFSAYHRSINAEHARIIDDYFTMYGYKINRVMVPHLATRAGFTYVKTVGCHIKADLCNEDVVKIESIFDHGITFWRDGDTIGDYTIENGEPKG